jgi:hypothetical protein
LIGDAIVACLAGLCDSNLDIPGVHGAKAPVEPSMKVFRANSTLWRSILTHNRPKCKLRNWWVSVQHSLVMVFDPDVGIHRFATALSYEMWEALRRREKPRWPEAYRRREKPR